MDASIKLGHNMQNLKYLTIIAAVTLIAGLAPLFLAGSPVAQMIDEVVIAISVIGLAAVLTLYFWEEAISALTFREEDSRWH